MSRHYSHGGRVARRPAGRTPGGRGVPNTRSLKERVGALRHLWPFLMMVWRTSPQLTVASLTLRLLRALLPVAALYIGKLIIDDVVPLMQTQDKPETLQQWVHSGLQGLDVDALHRIQDGIGQALTQMDVVGAEAERERSARLAVGPETGPLLRTLLRLRHDLVMIGGLRSRNH